MSRKDDKFQKQLDKINNKWNKIYIDNLENQGMLDLMYHQWKRFQHRDFFTIYKCQWQKWIRR